MIQPHIDISNNVPPYKDSINKKDLRHLPKLFTETASRFEFSKKRWIDIPKELLESYIRCGRPFPLIRAHRLEDHLKTTARIYYKCENLQPVGTFKTNTCSSSSLLGDERGIQ